MKGTSSFTRIYLHRDPVDFRKWVDGLSALVKTEMKLDSSSSFLFVFTNRRRDRIKALYWDRTGFAIWYKRLETARFHWPRKDPKAVVTLTPQQLDWLLDGYDIAKLRPHENLNYAKSF
jgi:transposase